MKNFHTIRLSIGLVAISIVLSNKVEVCAGISFINKKMCNFLPLQTKITELILLPKATRN